jgi:hypothetical protein
VHLHCDKVQQGLFLLFYRPVFVPVNEQPYRSLSSSL